MFVTTSILVIVALKFSYDVSNANNIVMTEEMLEANH